MAEEQVGEHHPALNELAGRGSGLGANALRKMVHDKSNVGDRISLGKAAKIGVCVLTEINDIEMSVGLKETKEQSHVRSFQQMIDGTVVQAKLECVLLKLL